MIPLGDLIITRITNARLNHTGVFINIILAVFLTVYIQLSSSLRMVELTEHN